MKPGQIRKPSVEQIHVLIKDQDRHIEALQEGYHAMQRTSARELSEQVKRNVGFDRRLDALEKREPGQHGWPEIRAELSRIGTRQFDAGRRLEIVSESCAVARKEARQARWIAFLCAVVLLGLSFAVALGKAA